MLPNGEVVTKEEDEPTSDMLLQAIEDAFECGLVAVSDMDSAPITFAGYGEPLLRSEVICDTASMIKERRHGVSLRVESNGLVDLESGASVASRLKESGVDQISIGLHATSPPQYQKMMKPHGEKGFGEVCSFVMACVEAGMEVECQAVEASGVDISAVRQLALSLGAHNFSAISYHP